MTSHPPSDCCTVVGSVHTGTPKGSIQKFANVDAYITHPAAGPSRRVILFLPDALGLGLPNGQLLADALAAGGYSVVMPDTFAGDPVPVVRPAGFDIMAWLQNHLVAHTQPTVDAVLAQIRAELQPTGVGAVGYCFGGKYVARLLARDGAAGVDAGFTAHPSFIDADELLAVRKPFSIAAAETDAVFPQALRWDTEKKLQEMGATYQINLFSGVEHGFACRGDENKKMDRLGKEGALKQALAWFDAFVP